MAGRVHVSLRTKVKTVATLRYSALVAFIREGDAVLIQRLRDQKLHVSAIERCVRDRVPFATLRGTLERWPTVAAAIDQYTTWLDGNQRKSDGTTEAAGYQLARFSEFAYVREGEERATIMGDLRLDDVTTADITAFQTFLNTVGNNGKPFALNTQTPTVSRIVTLYSWIAEEEQRRAIQEKRTARVLHSPVDARTQPHGHTARQRWLNQDEAARVLAATPDQYLFPVAAGLLGGLRISEMLFLRPPPLDVDLDAGVLVIQQKEWEYRGETRVWKPKTKRSTRRVNINDDLRAILDRHLARYASKQWLVPVAGDTGRPMFDIAFSRVFNRIVTDAGLEAGARTAQGVSYHTLRHTFASWLVMADENLLTVAKLLGNTLAMVEDTYGHLAPEHRKRAVGRLNGMVPIPPPISEDTNGNGSAPHA
jgi:integrase